MQSDEVSFCFGRLAGLHSHLLSEINVTDITCELPSSMRSTKVAPGVVAINQTVRNGILTAVLVTRECVVENWKQRANGAL